VSAGGFTIESVRPSSGTATAAPTTETVKTPAGTTYTRTGSATAKALIVGVCVTALGKTDDTGSIAATSIALRPAENGSCSSGFGGGFGSRGPGGRTPTSGSAGA
jgi:ribosomal protein S8E